jgi:hypothetical protein
MTREDVILIEGEPDEEGTIRFSWEDTDYISYYGRSAYGFTVKVYYLFDYKGRLFQGRHVIFDPPENIFNTLRRLKIEQYGRPSSVGSLCISWGTGETGVTLEVYDKDDNSIRMRYYNGLLQLEHATLPQYRYIYQ